MDNTATHIDTKSDIDTSGRRASISSMSSAGFDSSYYQHAGANNSNAAANNANSTQPGTAVMHENVTGNSLLSSRVSQSRHFGNMTPISGLNGSLLNQLQTSASIPNSTSNSVLNTYSNPSPIDTTNATAATNSVHSVMTNNHSNLIANAEKKLNDSNLDDNDITTSTLDSLTQSKFQGRNQQIQSVSSANFQAQFQQHTYTGSTNNSFNPNWLPQQQTNSLLNVTPWIEQQAQLAPNLNFHQYSSMNGLSSHSTGNDSNLNVSGNNLSSSSNQNLATNLSLLASSSMLSSLHSNPINQVSQQQQLRQPQYMKLPSATTPTTANATNISPPNNSETLMNTANAYPSSQTYPNYNNYQSYQNSNSSSMTLHKQSNTPLNTNNNNNNNNTASNIAANTSTKSNVDDDDLIPTAIVIKNIPFAIKREQLLNVMSKLNLPLPYAFNYHFDNGVFRGLAFANFNSIEETAMVVTMMNGREIDGRKLRVEYKKMLPLQERERIEREKKEKRCQLEEQHRSNSTTSLASLYSTVSAPPTTQNNINLTSTTNVANLIASNIESNIPASNASTTNANAPPSLSVDTKDMVVIAKIDQLPQPPAELDFNNPEVLEIYTRLIIFKEEYKFTSVSELTFSSESLSTNSRNYIKQLCAFLHLTESNDDGYVTVRRTDIDDQQSLSGTGSNIPNSSANTNANVSSMLNFQPSLIRSHSHSVINSNNGLSLNASNRYRQQSPRTITQTQPYSNFNNAQQPSAMSGVPISNIGALQQLQQQSQQHTHQLHHSSSTASLNLLRNKGLTAPTTPNASRQATFPPNNGGLNNLFNTSSIQQQQQQLQQHGLINQGFNNPQGTGGSNISLSLNKGMDELYNGIEYLSFDNSNV